MGKERVDGRSEAMGRQREDGTNIEWSNVAQKQEQSQQKAVVDHYAIKHHWGSVQRVITCVQCKYIHTYIHTRHNFSNLNTSTRAHITQDLYI